MLTNFLGNVALDDLLGRAKCAKVLKKLFWIVTKMLRFASCKKNPVNAKRSRLHPRQVQQLRDALELHSQEISSGIVHSETNFI